MVAGARHAIKERARTLDPRLFPFDYKIVAAIWHRDAATQAGAEEGTDPGLTAKELVDALETDKSMVSRAVKRLEEFGFLVRTPDPQDARVQRLHLSEEGARRYHEGSKSQRKVVRDRLRTWNLEHVEQLAGLLHRLNVSDDATDDDAPMIPPGL